MVISW